MDRLQNSRVWLVGGALAAALIVAVGWLVFIGPQLSSASDLRDQTVATQQQNDLLLSKERTLRAKSTRLTHYTSSLRRALAALPTDSGLPAFTRQLNAQAKAHRVAVSSVVVGAVSPVVAVAPVAPVAPAGGSATSSPPGAGTGPAGAPAGSLFSMQVTVQSEGSLPHQLAFLDAVRTAGPRRTLVSATQISPGTGSKSTSVDRASSFSTQLTIFSAPKDAAGIGQLKKLLSGDLGN